jgi:ubiquinone/menaquinone biosynthesis C-methylase UbiE
MARFSWRPKRGQGAATTTTPPIQSYGQLASDYDAKRYIGELNSLKESYRRGVLLELLPRHTWRALDVGCGTGRGIFVLNRIADRVFAIDGTFEMLTLANEKLLTGSEQVAYLHQANAACLPFRDGSFDVVICLNFVHLFTDVSQKQTFVREMARVLKPGGTAIVEFDNALQGVVLGVLRKYLGQDIGYDWPWVMRQCFPQDLLEITAVRGANLPGVWRLPALRVLERYTQVFPLKYLATKTFIQARRKMILHRRGVSDCCEGPP